MMKNALIRNSVFLILSLSMTLASAHAIGPINARVLQDSTIQSLFLGHEGENNLVPIQTVENSGVHTQKFQHYYRGLEVMGAWAFHHRAINRGVEGEKVRNSLFPIHIDTKPTLDAATVTSRSLSAHPGSQLVETPKLKIFLERSKRSARLVYSFSLRGMSFFDNRDLLIDANSGATVADLDSIQTIAPISVYTAAGASTVLSNLSRLKKPAPTTCQVLADGTDLPEGYPLVIQPAACKLEFNSNVSTSINGMEKTAANAAINSQAVLNYYLSHHGRNSFDDKGSTVVSVIHVGDKFNNAFWNPVQSIMAYGDGDPAVGLGDFSAALDVAGHEMSHGVTAATAKLTMMDESGALNEANSDFFGKLIANDGNWVVGRGIFLDPNNKGIRDLAAPGNITYSVYDEYGRVLGKKPSPSKMSEKAMVDGACDSSNDHCNVHTNSTIPSHAAYLVATAIGKEKAEKLYYFVLTHLMHPDETFKDMANDVMEGCTQLGFDAETTAAVRRAYVQVELL